MSRAPQQVYRRHQLAASWLIKRWLGTKPAAIMTDPGGETHGHRLGRGVSPGRTTDRALHPGIGHLSRRLCSAAPLPTREWIDEYDRPPRPRVHRGRGTERNVGELSERERWTGPGGDDCVLVARDEHRRLSLAWAARLMKPRPVLLMEGGRFRRRNMRRELVTEEELMSELRKRGVHDLADVDSVQMESDGEISVLPKEPGEERKGGGDRRSRQLHYRRSRR